MRSNINFRKRLTRSPLGDGAKTATILNAPCFKVQRNVKQTNS